MFFKGVCIFGRGAHGIEEEEGGRCPLAVRWSLVCRTWLIDSCIEFEGVDPQL